MEDALSGGTDWLETCILRRFYNALDAMQWIQRRPRNAPKAPTECAERAHLRRERRPLNAPEAPFKCTEGAHYMR